MINTTLYTSDRLAAVRLALGAALAHEDTAKLSNRVLASRIGCAESTVRRYRRIANTIGLAGAQSDQLAANVSVPDALNDRIVRSLEMIGTATRNATSLKAQRLNLLSTSLLILLENAATLDEVKLIYARTEAMRREFLGDRLAA